MLGKFVGNSVLGRELILGRFVGCCEMLGILVGYWDMLGRLVGNSLVLGIRLGTCVGKTLGYVDGELVAVGFMLGTMLGYADDGCTVGEVLGKNDGDSLGV